MRRIALLTGGGDCPGLNAVIRAVVLKASEFGYEVEGVLRGWKGLLDPPQTRPLTPEDVENIHFIGGTILLTSRANPYSCKEHGEVSDRHFEVIRNLQELNCDALIAIGGQDTLGVAYKLSREGVNVIGIPKTIDNDLQATDYTFGFDTAINIATESIDRLHTTAYSHERVLIVEIMGRHVGWMTLFAGLAGGAHLVLIPEVPFNIAEVCEFVQRRKQSGKGYTLIAIAEGAVPEKGSTFSVKRVEKDEFGHPVLGGISEMLAKEIEERTGLETRNVILGHLQRGGTPSAFDRVLGIRFGIKAVELVEQGNFGRMVSLRATQIVDVPLSDAVRKLKTIPLQLYEEAKLFFR